MIAIWCRNSTPTTRATVPTAIATLATFCLFLYLSHLEHVRSLRPSSILSLFFGFTLIFDLARLRTLHLIPENQPVAILFSVSLVGKVIVLALESTEKRHLLKKGFEGSAIETTGSIFNRYFFWWINDLLWKGSKSTLTIESLPVLADDIRDASDPQDLEKRWENGKSFKGFGILAMYFAYFTDIYTQLINTDRTRCYGPLLLISDGIFWPASFLVSLPRVSVLRSRF